MIRNINNNDYTKFAYHEGARIIRTVQDRICEITYTGGAPSQDEGETLCDMLIELHQLWYGVTLYTLRPDILGEDASYEDDEVYSDGRPVVSGVQLPVDPSDELIPDAACCGDIGEEIPSGGVIYVWPPAEADRPGLADDEAAAAARLGADLHAWKVSADLRARGLIEWKRSDNGHIVKHTEQYGRRNAVSVPRAT